MEAGVSFRVGHTWGAIWLLLALWYCELSTAALVNYDKRSGFNNTHLWSCSSQVTLTDSLANLKVQAKLLLHGVPAGGGPLPWAFSLWTNFSSCDYWLWSLKQDVSYSEGLATALEAIWVVGPSDVFKTSNVYPTCLLAPSSISKDSQGKTASVQILQEILSWSTFANSPVPQGLTESLLPEMWQGHFEGSFLSAYSCDWLEELLWRGYGRMLFAFFVLS